MNVKSLAALALASASMAAVAPAYAVDTVFSATLNGATESPPNGSTAAGLALVTFNDVLDTVNVNAIFIGLSAPATAAHIHCCTSSPGTGNAPVYLPLTSFPAMTYGSYNTTFSLTSTSFATLLAGAMAGEAYMNIHDANYPSGEIRGFLVSVVPEPASYSLMLGGLAAVGWVARRRLQG